MRLVTLSGGRAIHMNDNLMYAIVRRQRPDQGQNPAEHSPAEEEVDQEYAERGMRLPHNRDDCRKPVHDEKSANESHHPGVPILRIPSAQS
jgi:hypothetical protein